MNGTSKRTVLTVALATLGAGLAPAQKTADEALHALREGNRRFAEGRSADRPLGEGARRTLARGQSPFAIVVCCADSRVPPEHVFNQGLGDLVVVRLEGHVVDAEALATIERAAEGLGAQLCVVLGHESCGAIASCCEQVQQGEHGQLAASPSPALATLLQALEPAVRRSMAHDLGGKELRDRAEEEHAQGTAVEVLRRSKLLQQLARLGRFQVLPARYRLATGEVEWLPPRPLPAPGRDEPLEPGPPGMAPHVALRFLQAGHRRFLGAGRPLGEVGAGRREALVAGQQPMAIVVTCSDSRVSPEHLFDAGLGELVVIRNDGNVLTDGVLASIEHAALRSGAPLLLVLGHTSCGAVAAAVEQADDPHLTPSMRALAQRLEPAIGRARLDAGPGRDLVALATKNNVLRVLQQARQQSRILQKLEADGRFAMLPAVYDLGSGDIEWLRDASGDEAAATPAPAGETAARPGTGTGASRPGEAGGTGARHGDANGYARGDAGGHTARTNDSAGRAAAGGHEDGHGERSGAAGGTGSAAPHGHDMAWADDPHADTSPGSHGDGQGERHGAGPHDGDRHDAPQRPAHDGEPLVTRSPAHGSRGAGHGGEHGDEHEIEEPAPGARPKLAVDPKAVLALTGVVSLLLAALLTIRTRG